jgi:hypothetical protein
MFSMRKRKRRPGSGSVTSKTLLLSHGRYKLNYANGSVIRNDGTVQTDLGKGWTLGKIQASLCRQN